MNTKFKLLLLAIPLLLFSCSSDDDSSSQQQDNSGDVFISAEGAFGSKNGSISLLSSDFETTTNFAYTQANNNTPLAGLVQSVAFDNENAYVVLNDVNTLVIADKNTLVRKDIVTTGLQNPRYMAIVGNRGYITNWGDGSNTEDDYIAILDLDTNTIEATTISLDNGVEQIVARDNKLYVSHKGAFSTNNIVSVVDLSDNNSVTTITVNDNPDELFFSNTGELVVLSEGIGLTFGGPPTFSIIERTTSSISFIDINTNTVTRTLDFPENQGAEQMTHADGNIYYASNGEVFNIDVNATSLPTSGVVTTGPISGMEVNGEELYTLTTDFQTLSTLTVFDLDTAEEIFSDQVGLGATKIYFPN